MRQQAEDNAGHMEFHVSRAARERYQFDESLFSVRGKVIFANFHAARMFAQKMNDQRDLLRFPEQAVSAGQLNALGLLHEILHVLIEQYRKQKNPPVFQEALTWLGQQPGDREVNRALHTFVTEFPPVAVYRGDVDPDTYLSGTTNGATNREIVLEETLLLWLANMNPACEPFLELFDDRVLEEQTAYLKMIDGLQQFFETQPSFGPQGESLIAALRAPALASPKSLVGQLEFLHARYGSLLGDYLFRLLSSLDLIKEEEKLRFGPGGPGPIEVYEYTGEEPERFSPDRDWMPRLVLMAKNAFVWLDQLSKKYQRPFRRLDEVPDEELDMLARWGMTGLWLIGLWERSSASKRIKQMMGNPDAVASAYSLFGYQIAHDLGGEEACNRLRERAWQRGVRLASDMVPNHMGIDSRWVIEHPDWFLALDYSPYPSYSFSGPDLSWDERVGIFLEDHYYNHTDAAVVFKRVDRWTGSEKYIYHGNDGTSMPWNDTAQLNFLKPEVREAVIQTILHVARQFPIIRFDAAMTLAKKHYQRLWFPQPGTGGDIPTRAEHGLTKAQFDALMPQEFWREVVDRAAVEAPDTLLLAEAFWLMESYFVRTLGMHRVYNSAFMNILRDEENAKYRQIMKNTLEFDPEILKRFVNFMNNPDERTAVDQFGKGDKYFGICTMMATLPGLPMFGHGQIEGFAEKYGMEYQRAYWDERPDTYLIHRHEREIFPLLHRRYLFADVEHFRLYDLFTNEGWVNEDVFAYSNRYGDERALVVYHNKFATAKGWIKTSIAYATKGGQGNGRGLTQQNLGPALGLHNDENYFCLFRDHLTGLQYIRNSRELHEQGLYVDLNAYQCHVFLNFREVHDTEWHQYRNLAEHLNGRGVPSIEEAALEIVLRPILEPFKQVVQADMFRWLMDARIRERAIKTQATFPHVEGRELIIKLDTALLDEVDQKMLALLRGIKQFTQSNADETKQVQEIRQKLEALLQLSVLARRFPGADAPDYQAATTYLQMHQDDGLAFWGPLLGWVFTHSLGKVGTDVDFEQQSRIWIDEWRLDRIIASTLQSLGLDGAPAWRATQGIKLMLDLRGIFDITGPIEQQSSHVLETMLKQADVQQFLQINRYQGVLYFNKEAFDQLLWWMVALTAINSSADPAQTAAEVADAVGRRYAIVKRLREAEAQSAYQVEMLLAVARGETPTNAAGSQEPRTGPGTPPHLPNEPST